MIVRLIAFVVPLGVDTFVAAALGLSNPTPRLSRSRSPS
jgi:hypothetical protein